MKKHPFKKKADLLLLVLLLAVGAFLFLFFRFSGKDAATVRVEVEGKLYAEYPLSEDREVTIRGKDGGTDLLVIKEGKAFVAEASCPDHLCMKMGKIERSGESVICLPNQVVITVTNASEAEVDMVTGELP